MTDEQIKQNARTYANKEYMLCSGGEKEAAIKDFIAGAHSRDEEVERLEDKLAKQAVLLEERGLIKFANLDAQLEIELSQLRAELAKAQNPWRDAKTDPPKEKEIVITLSSSGAVGRSYLKKGVWRMVDYISHNDGDYVTHWMPIPEVKKGGEE